VKKQAAAWVKGLIKYGIGFGLLAWVISRYWGDKYSLLEYLVARSHGDAPVADTPGLRTALNGPIEYGWLAVVTALWAVTLSLQLVRWYILVRALDLPFTLRNAFRLGLVGYFYNTFLPGSVGGDLVKAYFIASEHPERKTRAVATVLIDRAMGLFGLILFVGVLGSVAWALGEPRISASVALQTLVEWSATISATAVIVFLLLGLLPQQRVDRFAGRLKSIPKVGPSVAELWYAVWMYRQRLKAIAAALGVTIITHVCMVTAFHCAAQVFPPADPATDLATFSEHIVIAPPGFIIQAVPLAPGGVGVGEAAFAGLYKLSGRPESRGILARLALRVSEWLIGLLGYIMYLRMKSHHELPAVEEVESAKGPPPST
jgi:uncharacterized membrane protein YbhN (UPF0104 family)